MIRKTCLLMTKVCEQNILFISYTVLWNTEFLIVDFQFKNLNFSRCCFKKLSKPFYSEYQNRCELLKKAKLWPFGKKA